MELTVYKAENYGNEQRDSIIPIGRIDARMTGVILGFTGEHDIRTLVAAGLLKPLGHPEQQNTKYFAWVDIQAKARDAAWLSKATDAIYGKWEEKNAKHKAKKKAAELKEAA